MGASTFISAGGAALRPVAGRSLIHIRPQLRATPAAAAASRSTTLATTSLYPTQQPSRHSSAWTIRRTIPTSPSALSSSTTTRYHRLKSTTPSPTAPQPHRPPKRRARTFISPRYLPVILLLAVGGIAWDAQWLFPSAPQSNDPAEQTALGPARKFIPFDVVAREQVSPTSFILTLKAPPSSHSSNVPSVSSLWDIFDLWCVEVKQPQIQVAREYTPLPPVPGSSYDEDTLRLYVRAVRGGEVSTYLSRLAPPSSPSDGPATKGDKVELRGPHGEFDLRSRLGKRGDRVVFLAGGTGIASALQAAQAVLPLADGPSMTIFWAVRSRDEIREQLVGGHTVPPQVKPSSSSSSGSWWNPFSSSSTNTPGSQAEALLSADTLAAPSPISRDLLALKVKYGDKLDVRVVVDQEGTAVREADLSAALTLQSSPTTSAGTTPTHAVEGCRFHSQTAHVGMVDGAPNAGKRSLFKQDDCACSADDAAPRGKNVFVVSGPEGFVQAYAGAKLWRDGGQLQGPVGGKLGAMQRRNPDILKDWIVLKL
ncbi:oxidoreductase FAD-binding domain-containing protein [Colletotrichum abscissum]|uniref:Oxidoreductase FAD-binding domain-containing protein n=1 Tax=Colletotrichum abscissum TaxID=1671311 RepID=A0A9P9X2U2_9PEZI|nr:oxidoreductase FAD-binding domain-containing protein [Colletotrichum abscissum]KAI3533095.1 oxidoreductase FAD-binding domain-containing protein [Colletotrichum abscissum]KAK1504877.1 oxidoreductase FAD-binding domain-containing protein [Colletotrichum abscissum]